MMTNIWQIAAGEPGRDYTALFLEHDVMFMGPGRYGAYDRALYADLAKGGKETASKVGQIRRFSQDVRAGDAVLLRRGYEVKAIGLAHESGYTWSSTFDDVFGWDLQHARRVVWQHHLADQLADLQSQKGLFEGRKQIPTFTAVRDKAVVSPLETVLSELKSREPAPLPPAPPPPLALDAFGEELFTRGVPNDAIDRVLLAIQRQRRLSRWYAQLGPEAHRPTEHEVVAHMILPLLLGLGWSEQLLAVEWRKIDLAGFWGTPTTKERCVLVCEAKVLGHGLQNVFAQAVDYVHKLGLTAAGKILLTDGPRLYLYERQGSEWSETPVGYMNAHLIRTNHLAPAGTNAVDTVVALTPAGVMRPVRDDG